MNDTIKIRGAENGRNISNTLNSDRTDGRICDGTQESLSQRNNHKRQHNSEEHIMESIPEFSYWYHKRSKTIYTVFNLSLDSTDGWGSNKVSLTSLNSGRRGEYIISFDRLRKNYKFIAESVSERQHYLFMNKSQLFRYQCAKNILRRMSEAHWMFFEQSQIVSEYEEMIGLRGSK